MSVDAQYYIEHQLTQPLMRLFGPIMANAESELFSGAHMRKLSNPTPATGALSMFVKKSLRCLGCKALIKDGSLCKHCLEHKAAEVVMEKLTDLNQKQQEYNRLWTNCQRCQGSFTQPVICSNRDCDVFYRRAGVRKEVQSMEESMARLKIDLSW